MELLDILKKIINEEFLVLKEKIINNIISQGLSASGSTVDSLEIQEFESSVALLGRKYFAALETGRKAGKIPYNYIEIIKEWAINKGTGKLGIEPLPYKRQESEKFSYRFTPIERALNRFAGSVAYLTRTQGSFLHRYGYTIEVFSKAVEETIERIKNRVEIELRQFIINDLNKLI